MNQQKQQNKIGGGLLSLPDDKRDFKLGALFSPIPIEKVPNKDFIIAEPLKIEDQKETDFCTGYASSAVSEDQERVDLCPLYPFAKIKQIRGEYEEWGANLRDACKAAVKFGFIKKEDSPFTLENGRDFLANWENWPKELDEKAKEHRKRSYFKISSWGYKDMFDALRATLWQYKHERRTILTGTLWEDSWTYAPNGIIPKIPGNPQFGHAFSLIGQKNIDELRLIAELSNGKEYGDKGLYFFSRETINRCFHYGNFMYQDIDPEEVKKILWSPCLRFWEKIKKIYSVVWK